MALKVLKVWSAILDDATAIANELYRYAALIDLGDYDGIGGSKVIGDSPSVVSSST